MSDKNDFKTAMVAELLGELGSLLSRAEALPDALDSASDRIRQTAGVLDAAGEKYRQAAASFTETAKGELSRHQDSLNNVTGNLMALTVEEQKKAIQEAAQAAVKGAFRSEKLRAGGGWVAAAFLVGGLVGSGLVFLVIR